MFMRLVEVGSADVLVSPSHGVLSIRLSGTIIGHKLAVLVDYHRIRLNEFQGSSRSDCRGSTRVSADFPRVLSQEYWTTRCVTQLINIMCVPVNPAHGVLIIHLLRHCSWSQVCSRLTPYSVERVSR